MAASELTLRQRLASIEERVEHLRAADLSDEAAFRDAIRAADRLCDEAVAIRWKLLQSYRSRFGSEGSAQGDPAGTRSSERVRRLLEDKGFRPRSDRPAAGPPAPDPTA
ncbi:MAG: hypothetical protein KatS3mg042_1498 [Rhodothermaceae bacterium]|nr:MAG: hypothetical protein KatS3mg042_1498 [Rhodothermaceae bacterium]